MSTHYDLLGVEKTASAEDIRRAYRKLALENHPDKGGDINKISEINEAYQTLSDKEKRAQYDANGKVGSENVADFFRGDPFRVFRSMFGDFQDSPQPTFPPTRRRVQRPQDVFFELPVSYSELYHGCTKKLAVRRSRFCVLCSGTGVEKCEEDIRCLQCMGSGKTTMVYKSFLGDQVHSDYCTFCQGWGIKAPLSVPKCTTCKGKRVVEERAIFEAVVEPGTPEGWDISCVGEGDDSLIVGDGRGDVVLKVTSKLPEKWSRVDQHLVLEVDIGLGECVTGFSKTIRHPAGHEFHASVKQVIRPSVISKKGILAPWIAADMGMPEFHEQPHGHAIILFNVHFPSLLVDLETESLFLGERNVEETVEKSVIVPILRPPTGTEEVQWIESLFSDSTKKTCFV